MRILFIVQGEGRGHMTQALALKDMLVKNGHQVVGVMVGKSKNRELPDFFSKKIDTTIYRFVSPNFLPSPKNKKANVWKTVAYNCMMVPSYAKSIHYIRKQIKSLDVDVVVNFYDMLAGLAYAVFPPKIPSISVSHQYLFLHPEYEFPDENKIELSVLRLYTQITCINSFRKLALSISKWEDVPEMKMVIVPPLLRKEVYETPVNKGNYLHGYMLNAGYAEEIIEFQKTHPDIHMHFFWDKKGAKEVEVVNEHLSFHKLNDKSFLEYLAGCKAYATTAGFESVCEAMYMGKACLMVPTHIEQSCNAYEAAKAGAGIVSNTFDLDKLIEYTDTYEEKTDFRTWAQKSEKYWMKEFNAIQSESHSTNTTSVPSV